MHIKRFYVIKRPIPTANKTFFILSPQIVYDFYLRHLFQIFQTILYYLYLFCERNLFIAFAHCISLIIL